MTQMHALSRVFLLFLYLFQKHAAKTSYSLMNLLNAVYKLISHYFICGKDGMTLVASSGGVNILSWKLYAVFSPLSLEIRKSTAFNTLQICTLTTFSRNLVFSNVKFFLASTSAIFSTKVCCLGC